MRFSAVVFLLPVVLACGRSEPAAPPIGDAAKGKAAIAEASCGVCHRIPGVDGAEGTMGVPLDKLAARPRLTGDRPNTPDNVVRWITNPQEIKADTTMPDLGIDEQVARDMAAYLLSLK